MKIIVASDSHYRNEILDEIVEKHKDADLFIHCGDLEDDPIYFPKWIFVRGNNDYFHGFVDQRVITAGSHKIFVTHSHRCSFLSRQDCLVNLARQNDCDIVLYGHTHVSDMSWVDGIVLVNPGSTSNSRDGKSPSYAILTLNDEKVEVEIVHREDW